MTPHNKAKKEEIAPVVLMPGDPLRAKWISENFLVDAILVNSVRNIFAYTGKYKGKKITIMASGMGLGSMHIYSYELFSPKYYDVKSIIRVGSCGSYSPDVLVHDLIMVNEAFNYDNHDKFLGLPESSCIQKASDEIMKSAKYAAEYLNIKYQTLRVNTTDIFYDCRDAQTINKETDSKVVDMETYALFANAKFHGKKALSLLTCSDSIISNDKKMTIEERETSLGKMILWALETAILDYPK